MFAPRRGRVLAVTALMPLVVGLAACGGSSDGDKDADADQQPVGACPGDISEQASTQPPADVPLPTDVDGAYEYFAQGETKVWNFALDGESGDLVQMRDDYDSQLEGKGYEIEDTDAEEGFEAESEFKGAHEGTTNFRPLCEGKVVFRLKLLS